MQNQNKPTDLQNLPVAASDFINSVIKKMRYRKKVRLDVRAELTAHFEDQLRDCATDRDREQKAQQLIADFGDPKLLAVLLRRAKKRCRPLWRKAHLHRPAPRWNAQHCGRLRRLAKRTRAKRQGSIGQRKARL